VYPKTSDSKTQVVDVDDLEKDWVLRWQRTFYVPIALIAGFVLPTVLSEILFQDWFGGLVHAGFGRMLVVQHCWFLCNSLCHIMGTQNYTQQHSSARSNALVSFLTMGEVRILFIFTIVSSFQYCS
jgi:stearoyl-CoA desaturase (delta-9 desaturase)